MSDTPVPIAARASGVFEIGGGLSVNRLGSAAIRLIGEGVWGDPRDIRTDSRSIWSARPAKAA